MTGFKLCVFSTPRFLVGLVIFCCVVSIHSDADARDSFVRMDANHDGVISRAEWSRGKNSFGRLDRNRDGVLTRKEMEDRQNFREVHEDLMRKR